ncbi:MAG TPA: hypothetical protein VK783_03990 [Bacteroidia bacterium]|jgi:hypothetical protein|nr:hypothetical protein [Bacteroidia bacterium]
MNTMRIYRLSLSLLLVIGFIACKPKTENVIVNIVPLRESSLYNAVDVYNFMSTYKDTNEQLAMEYYKKYVAGMPEATYYLKRSLSLYPDYNHYRELGDQLCKEKKYVEMNELYRMLVFPLSAFSNKAFDRKYVLCPYAKPGMNLIVDYVISNILTSNTVWNSRAEESALTDSIGLKMNDIKNQVLNDPRIKLTAPTADNKNILWTFLTNDEKLAYFTNASLNDSISSHIDDTNTTFEIDKNNVSQFYYTYGTAGQFGRVYEQTEGIHDKFDHLVQEDNENSKLSLNNRYHDINYERNFSLNDSVEILIYAIDTSAIACPKDMRHIYHRLVTYYNKGGIITTMVIAAQSGEELSTVKFNHNTFTITYYKRYWEKPYKQDDFDNHLSKIEQTDQSTFKIFPLGDIKKRFSPLQE